MNAMMDKADTLNKKVFEKRLQQVDNEIERCGTSKNRKLCYEDLLEMVGISAEVAKLGPVS